MLNTFSDILQTAQNLEVAILANNNNVLHFSPVNIDVNPAESQQRGAETPVGIEDLDAIIDELLSTESSDNKKVSTSQFNEPILQDVQNILQCTGNTNITQNNNFIFNEETMIPAIEDILPDVFGEEEESLDDSFIQYSLDEPASSPDYQMHEPSPFSPESLFFPAFPTFDAQHPLNTFSEVRKTKRNQPNIYRFNPKPLSLKPSMSRGRKHNLENLDEEYKEKRRKNNEASRRSRMARRYKECMIMEEMQELRKENEELRIELKLLKKLSTVY